MNKSDVDEEEGNVRERQKKVKGNIFLFFIRVVLLRRRSFPIITKGKKTRKRRQQQRRRCQIIYVFSVVRTCSSSQENILGYIMCICFFGHGSILF